MKEIVQIVYIFEHLLSLQVNFFHDDPFA